MRPERPPEEWLFKAWHSEVMIDLIFAPSGVEITDEVLDRADTIPVMAVATPVMALEDVLVTMLCAIDEHSLDYSRLVAIARALREQIEWRRLRARTAGSPYAEAFFTLVESTGIAPARGRGGAGSQSRVRVLDGGARSAPGSGPAAAASDPAWASAAADPAAAESGREFPYADRYPMRTGSNLDAVG
jgi:hypothetical protein